MCCNVIKYFGVFISRLVFYDLNGNFQVSTTDDIVLQNMLDLPPKESFKDMHAGSPIPPFGQTDVDLFLKSKLWRNVECSLCNVGCIACQPLLQVIALFQV